MSSIDTLFNTLRAEGRKALMPFVAAGDPNLQFTADLLQELVRRGCALCEVGIPYSDPIADGPVIQSSYTRAMNHGFRLCDALEMLRNLTPALQAPIVTMVSYATVYRHGPDQYVADAMSAGVAGAIVPDLPIDEATPLARICDKADFSLIQLVTPTTPRERALRIAETSSGFLYYVSVTGITGERRDLPAELTETVGWLRQRTALPICIGFGISQPEHIRKLAPVADGLIVGSAIMRRIEESAGGSREATIDDIGRYVQTLLLALDEQ